MRILNKLVYACCSIAFGLMALPSCEGGELYDVNAPDWISEKVDSIANSKKDPEEEVLEGMQEDVYSFGNADYTSGFWTAFSKYYVVPDGQKWHGVFNLNINPADNTYYKNFALVITNDADRGGEGYTEYGAYRFDTTNDTLAYNSQWGSHLFFKYTSSTLMLSPVDNLDETVQKLGGKVTLTVDRTNENAFSIKIQNASATKTYKQPYKLPNLNADASNTNIRCSWYPKALTSTSCNRTSFLSAALLLPKTRSRSRWYCKMYPIRSMPAPHSKKPWPGLLPSSASKKG